MTKEQEKPEENKETEEETLNRNLSDPIFVNYNVLSKLNSLIKNSEEIKRINYSILKLLDAFYQKAVSEEKSKEEKEGVFKSK